MKKINCHVVKEVGVNCIKEWLKKYTKVIKTNEVTIDPPIFPQRIVFVKRNNENFSNTSNNNR